MRELLWRPMDLTARKPYVLLDLDLVEKVLDEVGPEKFCVHRCGLEETFYFRCSSHSERKSLDPRKQYPPLTPTAYVSRNFYTPISLRPTLLTCPFPQTEFGAMGISPLVLPVCRSKCLSINLNNVPNRRLCANWAGRGIEMWEA